MKKIEFLSILFIFIISAISVLDLFINVGRPATFDAPTHMTDIAGYSTALLSGDFPVFWLDKFGNYGMPIGFFSHQLPLTVAGTINIFLHNPVFTFYFFFFLGVFLTNITFYIFLRLYFSRLPSLAAITLLTFSAYRIINIYIRGDMPETFSGIFLGLILVGMYLLIKQDKIRGFFLISLAYFCLTITHPMMLLTYGFFIFPYLLFLLLEKIELRKIQDMKKLFTLHIGKYLVYFIAAIILGIGMGGYFILPLVSETKYLYFGQEKNHLSPQFLSFNNFFGENWFYFYQHDIFPRGQFIQIGIFECVVVILGTLLFLYESFKKGLRVLFHLETVVLISTFAVLFMTTSLALPLYAHFLFLTNLQFPWRMLSLFIFLPPIFIAVLLQKLEKKVFIAVFCILVIALIRFPQLYGKNYTNFPIESYYFTPYNLFPILMNTIWTGKTEDYPIEKQKIGIIEGRGTILSENVHNSSRSYTVNASTSLRLVDYTFYFPGWHVYVDNKPTAIEFQDPSYRGVITYIVPAGEHQINVTLQDTVIRRVGKILSIFFIAIFFFLFLRRNWLQRYIYSRPRSSYNRA